MSSRQAAAPSSNPRVTGNVPIRMLFICSPASESATRAIQVCNTAPARPAQGLVPQSSGGQEPLEIYPPCLPPLPRASANGPLTSTWRSPAHQLSSPPDRSSTDDLRLTGGLWLGGQQGFNGLQQLLGYHRLLKEGD